MQPVWIPLQSCCATKYVAKNVGSQFFKLKIQPFLSHIFFFALGTGLQQNIIDQNAVLNVNYAVCSGFVWCVPFARVGRHQQQSGATSPLAWNGVKWAKSAIWAHWPANTHKWNIFLWVLLVGVCVLIFNQFVFNLGSQVIRFTCVPGSSQMKCMSSCISGSVVGILLSCKSCRLQW